MCALSSVFAKLLINTIFELHVIRSLKKVAEGRSATAILASKYKNVDEFNINALFGTLLGLKRDRHIVEQS